MKHIPRLLEQEITKTLKSQKVAFIFGARRTGKTVIMKRIAESWGGKALYLNGEDYENSIANHRHLLNGVSLLVIDEAQSIPDIGSKIKLILDEVRHVCVLVSSSSFFNSQNKTYRLTPFSQKEISIMENFLETRKNLEERLKYGSYPEVVMMKSASDKSDYLREIANTYLLKDILAIDGLKSVSKMRNLLRIMAFQLGKEVSYDELGRQLGMSKNTAEKYLDLLSKSFILFRLCPYSKNLKKEVAKAGKWYFYDVGVRNAFIGDFKHITLNNIGALWENYIICERLKHYWNSCRSKNFYFWRTYNKQEIDFIEETKESGELHAYDIKWRPQKSKLPTAFANAYGHSKFSEINRENYLEFVLDK